MRETRIALIKNVQRILLLPLCGLGDAVCYLSSIRAIRRQYPEAEITVVVATSQAKEILQDAELELNVFVFNRRTHRGLRNICKFVLDFRRERFDFVMSRAPRNSIRIPILAFLSGAKTRVGASSERISFLYNRKVDVQFDVHSVEKYRQLLAGIGIHVPFDEFRPKLEMPKHARESAAKLWKEVGFDSESRVVGIASGADDNLRGKWNPAIKRWTVEAFAGVVKWLVEEARYRVVMFGVHEESDLANKIAATANVEVVDLCGKTSIGNLQWLLCNCAAIICNDTGIMHIASALEVPVVAIFGPTNPASFGPIGNRHRVVQASAPCAPCFPNPTCLSNECMAMNAISPTQVINRLIELLGKDSPDLLFYYKTNV